jgi:heat shock protein HslJ
MKKNKLHIIDIAVFSALIVAIIIFYALSFTTKKAPVIVQPVTTSPVITNDVRNLTYTIEGENFTVVNGLAVKSAKDGVGGKITVQIFGEPTLGDFNGDGVKDAAVLLTKNAGGSGTFFYAVLGISNNGVYYPTNALLLGDRIAPQTINVEKGRAVYNYAERKATDPMTTKPSVGKSLYVQYDAQSGTIGEFVKNFEGEANPATMNLTMKKWSWVKTQMNDGKIITPKKANTFTLTFSKDNKVSVTTDCNGMGGTYAVQGKKITFGPIMSTKMFCEGSQEGEFAGALANISSYLFTNKGELILEIKMDSGTMIFK